jgi:putative transcription factor
MDRACEVCGTPIHTLPNSVEIDGAILQVCGNCAKLGREIRSMGGKGTPIRPAGSAQGSSLEPEYETDPDYSLLVREAREKMGLSQEALGRSINEKPSVIRLVETRRLKPDMILAQKLMHALKINLLVPSSELNRRE